MISHYRHSHTTYEEECKKVREEWWWFKDGKITELRKRFNQEALRLISEDLAESF
jgi:hypothetical protein